MADVMSVAQAAAELGVSDRRIRALINAGALDAQRLGASWLLDADSVRERAARQPASGRPLEPATAWLVLAALQLLFAADSPPNEPLGGGSIADAVASVAAGDAGDRSSHQARKRLVDLLREPAGPQRWARWLSRRATVRRVWAHPAALDRLRLDDRLHAGASGSVDAVLRLGLALSAGDPEMFYVAAGNVDAIHAEFRLRDDPKGKVELRVVADAIAARYLAPGPVPAAVALADLLESRDAREHDLAARALRDLAAS